MIVGSFLIYTLTGEYASSTTLDQKVQVQSLAHCIYKFLFNFVFMSLLSLFIITLITSFVLRSLRHDINRV